MDASWSDIITLEQIDQVTGAPMLYYRDAGKMDPVVNDEDRYESWRNPTHDRYFFRRLMWGSLLSGGAATYGGGQTWQPFVSTSSWQGVQGYNDLNNAGLLQGGADDFIHIHKFFDDTGLDLIGLESGDTLVGNDFKRYKSLFGSDVMIAYLANPTGTAPETDNASSSTPSVTIAAGFNYDNWYGDWFNPTTGDWSSLGVLSNANRTFTAPSGGDWLLLISEQNIAPNPNPPRHFQDDSSTKGLWHLNTIHGPIPASGYQDFVDDDNSFGTPDRADGRELLLGAPGVATHPTFLPTGGPDGSGALLFDGVDDYAVAPGVWDGTDDHITIDFQMRPDALPDDGNLRGLVGVLPFQTLLQDDGTGNNTGNLVVLAFYEGGGHVYGFSQGGLALGEWYEIHAEVTSTGGANGFGVMTLSVDDVSVLIDMDAPLAHGSYWASEAVIGRQAASFTRYFTGALDEIRIATDSYVEAAGSAVVPEPASAMLMLLGLGWFAAMQRRLHPLRA